MKEYRVKDSQQLEDVALSVYGTIEAVPMLCSDNKLTMDDLLYADQILKVRSEVPVINRSNVAVQLAIAKEGIVPVSGVVGEKPNEGYAAEDYFGEDYNYN